MRAPARDIRVIPMNLVQPEVDSPLTTAAEKAEAEAGERYLVAVGFNEQLPRSAGRHTRA